MACTYSWLFSISWNVTKTWQKGEFMIFAKMQNCVLLWKWYIFFLNEWYLPCLKKVGNSFFYWRLHSSQDKFQNVDLDICAHTWHSVSVMGHKQGFNLAVPEFSNYWNCTSPSWALQVLFKRKLLVRFYFLSIKIYCEKIIKFSFLPTPEKRISTENCSRQKKCPLENKTRNNL